MGLVNKAHRTIAEQRRFEDMQAQLERQEATLEYVAAMADIDLPIETDEIDGMEE